MPPKRQQRYMKRCGNPECENTFGPGTKGELGRQKFCSPDCGRVQRNSRTTEILRLADLGYSTGQIATEVEATPAWIRFVRAREKNGR